MNIRWLMRGYRMALLFTVGVSLGISIAVFILMIAATPHTVLYVMDVLSPITRAFRDVIWFFFPEATWLRTAGAWLGFLARSALSKAGAQSEVLGRLYIDGFIFVTFLTWIVGLFVRVWLNVKLARWFNKRYEIVRKPEREKEWVGTSRHEPKFDFPTPTRKEEKFAAADAIDRTNRVTNELKRMQPPHKRL